MITLTREETQQVLELITNAYVNSQLAETLRARLAEPEKEQKMSDYDRGYLHGFDDAMEKPYEQREQEQIALPTPFRAQGQQIASDGDDKAFCDLYSKEQMLAYGKASELAIDKTLVKRIATQLGWKPPLDVEQEPVAWMWLHNGAPVNVFLHEAHPQDTNYWEGKGFVSKPLYPAPQKREWVGLTDEEIRNEAKNHVFDESFFSGAIWARGKMMGKNYD